MKSILGMRLVTYLCNTTCTGTLKYRLHMVSPCSNISDLDKIDGWWMNCYCSLYILVVWWSISCCYCSLYDKYFWLGTALCLLVMIFLTVTAPHLVEYFFNTVNIAPCLLEYFLMFLFCICYSISWCSCSMFAAVFLAVTAPCLLDYFLMFLLHVCLSIFPGVTALHLLQ